MLIDPCLPLPRLDPRFWAHHTVLCHYILYVPCHYYTNFLLGAHFTPYFAIYPVISSCLGLGAHSSSIYSFSNCLHMYIIYASLYAIHVYNISASLYDILISNTYLLHSILISTLHFVIRPLLRQFWAQFNHNKLLHFFIFFKFFCVFLHYNYSTYILHLTQYLFF